MEFTEFVNWAFQLIVSGSVVYGVAVLGKLRSSVDELNIKVALIIERTATHEKILDKHDARITQIERH